MRYIVALRITSQGPQKSDQGVAHMGARVTSITSLARLQS